MSCFFHSSIKTKFGAFVLHFHFNWYRNHHLSPNIWLVW
jgi:hypothetical protein